MSFCAPPAWIFTQMANSSWATCVAPGFKRIRHYGLRVGRGPVLTQDALGGTTTPRVRLADRCAALGLPPLAAETYTARSTAIPAVQSNKTYLAPCTAVPSMSVAAASDSRCSLAAPA